MPELTMLPPRPGLCRECGADHVPEDAHNAQSLYYQYWFYGKHGRWPCWADAIAHCSPERQEVWKTHLQQHGVDVNGSVHPKK